MSTHRHTAAGHEAAARLFTEATSTSWDPAVVTDRVAEMVDRVACGPAPEAFKAAACDRLVELLATHFGAVTA